MVRLTLIPIALALTLVGSRPIAAEGVNGQAAPDQPPPTFKAAVDLVSVAAIVQDERGRVVRNLSRSDFEVLESGKLRTIVDFSTNELGPVSVALLFDVSGSMLVGTRMAGARHAADHLLSWLQKGDEAALFTFDTKLRELQTFTSDPAQLHLALDSLEPFGATSLYDAVHETAGRLVERSTKRRAIVVLSDGNDTNSRMGAPEVSAAASAIDVPVYLIAVADPIDHPGGEHEVDRGTPSPLVGGMADLARWTGGDLHIVSTPAHASIAARQVLSELRHQYLIAFEAATVPGWYRLEVRTKDKELRVRARAGYFSGEAYRPRASGRLIDDEAYKKTAS